MTLKKPPYPAKFAVCRRLLFELSRFTQRHNPFVDVINKNPEIDHYK
jgi:hypothetical protein